MEKAGNEKESENKIKKEKIMGGKRIFFIISGFIVVASIIAWFLINSTTHFDYKGIKFYIENESGRISYKTSLPATYTDEKTGKVTSEDYNLYFRNDPRLEKVNFDGEMVLRKNMVLNITEEFKDCNEEKNIALKNLINLYSLIGTKVIKNETKDCDYIFGRYSWVNIHKGAKTEIVEVGIKGGCYNVHIKDCEISEGVERFLLETLIRLNKK